MGNETENMAATMISGTGDPSGSSVSGKRRGRPPGSKNKPKDGEAQSPESRSLFAPFVYQPDDASIAASTMMGSVVWSIVAPMFKMRDLKNEEREKLGRALDPVLCRWIPILGDWKYEAGLIMAIVGLAQVCKKEYVPKPEGNGNGSHSET